MAGSWNGAVVVYGGLSGIRNAQSKNRAACQQRDIENYCWLEASPRKIRAVPRPLAFEPPASLTVRDPINNSAFDVLFAVSSWAHSSKGNGHPGGNRLRCHVTHVVSNK